MANLGGFDMLRTEYEGIKVMHDTKSIKVPEPICYGSADYNSFAVFEKLNLGGRADPALAGRKLAEMHADMPADMHAGMHADKPAGYQKHASDR